MEDDVLARVISVEKEIQACLETERTRAREWLEEVRERNRVGIHKGGRAHRGGLKNVRGAGPG